MISSVRTRRVLGLAAVAASVAIVGQAHAGSLTVIPSYSDPLGGSTSVLGLNNNGEMTGSITDSAGTHGFVRDAAGNYTLFDVGSTGFTQGRSLNDAGVAVGYTEGAGGDVHGRSEFVRSADGTTVTTLANGSTPLVGIAQGINNSGAIVGDYYTGVGSQMDGYELSGSTFTDIAFAGDRVRARGINDSGEIVGWVTGADGEDGFILNGANPPSFFSDPNAVNGTFFEDINSSGLISGEYDDASGHSHGFIFNSNTDVFTDLNVPGATDVSAFGINDAGQVVLNTFNSDGVATNYLYSPGGVPEPATWALMLTGFFGLGSLLRRQRKLALS